MSRFVSLLLAFVLAATASLAVGGTSDPTMRSASSEDPMRSASSDDPVRLAQPAATELTAPHPTDGLVPRSTTVPRDELHAEAPAPPPSPSRQVGGTGVLLAASGTSQDPIDGGGRTVRFSVEVEQGTGLDPDTTAALVEEALYDARSWAATRTLQRVAPSEASIHVVVATPGTVDRLCARAGLRTGGWLSCWNGRVAAINLDRWTQGVGHIDDLAQYRRYVVNHEVGHGLGLGHVGCPGRGELAPVMMQQTKSLSGCVANEWPHP